MSKLKDWQNAANLTADEAAAKLSISRVQWFRLLNGSRKISALRVNEVSRVTGIPAHELRPDVFRAPQAEDAA